MQRGRSKTPKHQARMFVDPVNRGLLFVLPLFRIFLFFPPTSPLILSTKVMRGWPYSSCQNTGQPMTRSQQQNANITNRYYKRLGERKKEDQLKDITHHWFGKK